jgi:peptidoglycan/xylan/chitin deacetylase (PgdA/CDA1 family)
MGNIGEAFFRERLTNQNPWMVYAGESCSCLRYVCVLMHTKGLFSRKEKLMKNYVRNILISLLLTVFAGQVFAQHDITYWPNNKKGVVSLTFDDGLPSHLSLIIPTLNSYGMRGTFYVVTDTATADNAWNGWRAAAAQGHEIGSHALSHPSLPTLTASQLQNELQQSKSIIEAQIPSQKCLSFAYPFGDVNDTVKAAAAKYYIAARGITYDINYPNYDFYNLRARGDDPGSTLSAMIDATDMAEDWGEWLALYLHSMNGDGYGDWDMGIFTSYLDFLKTRDIEIETLVNTVKYIKERGVANLSLVSSSASQIILNLTDNLDNSVYNMPLTLRSVVPSGWNNVNIVQGSRVSTAVSVLESGQRVVYYHGIPDGGQIALTSAGGLQISSLNPSTVTAGSASFALRVVGSGFVNGAVVRWSSSNRPTTFLSATELRADISAADVSIQGAASVTVKNPDGSISGAVSFTINGVQVSSVTVNPASVTGGTGSIGTVTLSAAAPPGGATVQLSSSSAAAAVPSEAVIAAGSTSTTFNIQTAAVSASTSITIAASYGGVSKTANLTVVPPALSSVSLNPTAVVGGATSEGTVTLSGPAPSGGSLVSLSSSRTSTASVPSSVRVPEGSSTATFTVTTYATTISRTVTITARFNSVSKTTSLSVTVGSTLSSVSLNPASVVGGSGSQGTVTLSGSAPSGGAVVTLSSSNPSAATVPASATIAAGNSNTMFAVTTAVVTASTTVTVTANYGGTSKTATVTVLPPSALSAIGLNPASVSGGSTSQATVTLNGSAPSGGAVITLTSSNASTAMVPASVAIAAGATSATFTVNTVAVAATTNVTISADYNGISKTAQLTIITQSVLSSVSLNPASVLGGSSSQGTVVLSGAAPTGGAAVLLSSGNSTVASVPASVTIAAGSTAATFTVATSSVSSPASVTITASYGGTSRTAGLTVTPPATLYSLPNSGWSLNYVDSEELAGENGAAINAFDGNTATNWHTQWTGSIPGVPHEIQINLGASYSVAGFRYLPRQDGSTNGRIGQYEFYLSQDGTTWIPVVTGSFANSAAEKEVQFTAVAARYVRLRAITEVNGNPWTSIAELRVLSPNLTVQLSSIGLNPATVVGGNSVQGTIALTSAAPAGGAIVTLSGSNDTVALVPSSVTISAGSTTASFNIATAAVSASTALVITANYSGTAKTATLNVSPFALSLLPNSGWSLRYADSQELTGEDGAAGNAFDGNSNTFWHTAWFNSSPGMPHEIQIDLGAAYSVGGFRYLPRQDGEANGRIKQYEFYLSLDGTNWGSPVATGTFANSAAEKEVQFAIGSARYIRLRALSEVNGNPWAAAAEIKVLAAN